MLAMPALARVGGGQDYSGPSDSGGGYSPSSSSSGSSSSGEGELIGFLLELLIRLVIYHPRVGIPLLLVAGVIYLIYSRGSAPARRTFEHLDNWSKERPRGPQPVDLDSLKQVDPNFSAPLFLDFVNLLYTKIQLLRGDELSAVGACLSTTMRDQLSRESAWQRVIIGGLRVSEVSLSSADQKVVVEVEANLESASSALYVVDALVLRRRPGAVTAAPEAVRSFACPNCGNTAPVDVSGRCSACQEQVNNGRFGWLLTDLSREETKTRKPASLPSSGVEAGTDRPTVRDPNLQAALTNLQAADHTFSLEGLEILARTTFLTLQEAWTEGRWEKARPLETDDLFNQHRLGMEQLEQAGQRNVLEDIEVTRSELCRLESDRHFQSATFRIFARMKDSTIRISDGAVLSGNPHGPREFSEYWTFVRRAGVTSKARELTSCPNCGANLDRVTVAGVCQYCDANITRGDFDWILSRVEQDEAYR
jgi:predicted RNA-binding Zn-ribbon protein involved in translation (DUF1610 family)